MIMPNYSTINDIDFMVPSTDGNFILTKQIPSWDHFYFYLYLSSIILPDDGNPDPHFYIFRENKEYKLNDNITMTAFEKEYLFECHFVTKTLSIDIPIGTYQLKVYTPERYESAIISGDMFSKKLTDPIKTSTELLTGGRFDSQGPYLLVNINEVFNETEELLILFDRDISVDVWIKVDKEWFVNLYEKTKNLDRRHIECYNYGSYNKIDVSDSHEFAFIKKNAIFENDCEILYPNLMRYNNPVMITDRKYLIGDGLKLSDIALHPYLTEIGKYYLDSPSPPPSYYDKIYKLDKNILKRVFYISRIDKMEPVYFFRKIPGLKRISFKVYIAPEFDGSVKSLRYLDSDPIDIERLNFDIMAIEDDYVYPRFIRKQSIDFDVPPSSNTVMPMLSFSKNYKDMPVKEMSLFMELIIDYDVLIKTILSFGDVSLWDDIISQSIKFLFNGMTYSNSPYYFSTSSVLSITDLFKKDIAIGKRRVGIINTSLPYFGIISSELPYINMMIIGNDNVTVNFDNSNVFVPFTIIDNPDEPVKLIKYLLYTVSDNKKEIYMPTISELANLRDVIFDKVPFENLSIEVVDYYGIPGYKFSNSKIKFFRTVESYVLSVSNPDRDNIFIIGLPD